MKNASTHAFTLIELLVVIAILAILAGLLFPVFSRAKISADQATAISNVKQLSLANDLYSNDNDDMFCVYFSGYDLATQSYGPPLRYWPQLVSDYISPVSNGHGASGQAIADDLPRVFFDPVEPFKSQLDDNYQFGIISSWGVSDDLVDWYAPSGVQPSKTPCNRSEVAYPADCLHLVETWDWLVQHGYPGNDIVESPFEDSGLGSVVSVNAPYNASYQKTALHQSADPKGRNVVEFCDGHVKTVSVSQLLNDTSIWSRSRTNTWP